MRQVAKKLQVFDVVGTQGVFAHVGDDGVIAFAGVLFDLIELGIDHINVVASSAAQGVVAQATVEQVVGIVANQGVATRATDDPLDGDQGVVALVARDCAQDQIDGEGPSGTGIRGQIGAVSATEHIVAQSAHQGVVTRATGDDVVQRVAFAIKTDGARVDQVFDVLNQLVGGQRGAHRVGALPRSLGDLVQQ